MRPAALALCLSLLACSSAPPVFLHQDRSISLKPGDLESHGIAFITPSTVTGQEQEKQAVALLFTDAFARKRPKVQVATLPDTINAVNGAGLSAVYRKMFDDSRDSGLFPGEALKQVSAATGKRFIGQLKVQKFSQISKNRMNVLGVRAFETQIGEVRLFFQIWDGADGSVAWEAMQERSITSERVLERPILQEIIIKAAAEDLISRLP